ncbi:S9 family peptidase [Nonomuraea sp. SBT364]|uniref:S9 family peptidase n=1 Tax=Nonomuraea sp. SBT364 TaxID=1580530 RepID=UPI000A5EF1BE|nr:alpha/beta fold hydrolase [Nonomuraea sp. SBT364]
MTHLPWSCWAPALAPDCSAVVHGSDHDGTPRAWIQPARGASRPVPTGPHPVVDVHWAPTGARLAVLLAPGGGEHTEVWTVRPDGGDLRPLAAPSGGSAVFIRWTERGEDLLVAETHAGGRTDAVLVDAATGGRQVVASGTLLRPAAVSRDHATVLVRHGPRGARRMSVRRVGGGEHELLPGLPGTTDYGILSPDGRIAYLVTDAGRDRTALLAVHGDELWADRPAAYGGGPRDGPGPPGDGPGANHLGEGGPLEAHARRGGPHGGGPVVLAEREGAELDQFALSADGRRAVLVWNERGRSRLELLDPRTGVTAPLSHLPADVVTSIRVSLDGTRAVLAAEGAAQPSQVYVCNLASGAYEHVAGAGRLPGAVEAEPVRFAARDGLELAAWLYRPPRAQGPAPFLVHLHGGPEDQERPTFNPLYQHLLACGIGVFAPNVRGSAGYGRAFREADDRERRFRAIDDVADCVAELVRLGAADPSRIACMGWSYGGYLTLAALVTHPALFRAGVNVCGMADFGTFYARTDPWVAAAAVREYGHPDTDRDLLRALSPLRSFDRLRAPLLVVHGRHDTNVPFHQAEQMLEAAAALGLPCDALLFDDEGHTIRQVANRVAYITKVTGWLEHHLIGSFADGR